MTLPNFIVIGQMKAGTSSLHAYLRQHPDIFMPSVKELRFFSEVISEDGKRLLVDDAYRRTRVTRGMPVTFAEYEALFEPAAGRRGRGEASPEYANSPRAPAQIAKYLPEVRLIVSLRHPADRLYSQYQMMKRGGRIDSDFRSAFRAGQSESWVRGSFSYEALKRYYERFDASRIKAIKFDALADRTQATLQELFDFLGVDRSFRPDTSTVHNEGGDFKSALLGRLSGRVQGNRALMDRLKTMMPAAAWRVGKEIVRSNKDKAPPLTSELRREVAQHYRDDTLKLQELVGLDLSDWL